MPKTIDNWTDEPEQVSTEPSAGLREALEEARIWIESQGCEHDDLRRGGTIWTICGSCGRKWADDEGGFKPDKPPRILKRIDAALGAAPGIGSPEGGKTRSGLTAKPQEPDPKGAPKSQEHAALAAAPQAEPVAELREDMKGGGHVHWLSEEYFEPGTKLYAAPPAAAPVQPNPRDTPFGREAEKLADDYLALNAENAALRERLAAHAPLSDEQIDAECNALCSRPTKTGFSLMWFTRGVRFAEAAHGISPAPNTPPKETP